MRFRRNRSEDGGPGAAPPEPAVQPAPEPGPPPAPDPEPPPAESPLTVESESDGFGEHPEVFVGAAFVGGFALAQILKRFGK